MWSTSIRFFPSGCRVPDRSVSPLARFGNNQPLDAAALQEARRIARRRVVVKHPKHECLPDGLESDVIETVTTDKSRVQYDIFAPF